MDFNKISELEKKWWSVLDEVDEVVLSAVQEKITELEKDGDIWEFYSGMGTFCFAKNGEIIHSEDSESIFPEVETDRKKVREIMRHINEINDIFICNGFYPGEKRREDV